MKKVEANKDVQNTNIRRQSEVKASIKFVENQLDVEASKKTVEPNKGFVKNNNMQLEVEASIEIAAPSKLFVQNNNTKKKLKSMMDHQVKGSIESHVSKNIGEQNKEIIKPIIEYLNKNKEQDQVYELDDEDIKESEMGEDMETDMNYKGEEIEGTDVNTTEGLIRRQGKTLCRKIHARELKDREEITMNGE
ncbi:hypothetical protein P8452_66284 [Trifolium repens]|nr:hypothetical protein P8452_66284 [Trifolium repens]